MTEGRLWWPYGVAALTLLGALIVWWQLDRGGAGIVLVAMGTLALGYAAITNQREPVDDWRRMGTAIEHLVAEQDGEVPPWPDQAWADAAGVINDLLRRGGDLASSQRYRDAMAVLEPIHDHLEPLPPVDRLSVLSYLQWLSGAICAHEDRLSLLDQMDRLVDEAFPASSKGRVAAQCDIGLARSHAFSQSGDFETAAVELDRVAALIPDTIDGLRIRRGLGRERTWLAFERADWTGVLDHAATTAPLYGEVVTLERSHQLDWALLHLMTSWALAELGRLDEATDDHRLAESVLGRFGAPDFVVNDLLARLALASRRGHVGEALLLYGPTSAAARASENPKVTAEVDTEMGWIWHELGEADRARASFEAAHDLYASIGHAPKQAQLAGFLAQIDGRRD